MQNLSWNTISLFFFQQRFTFDKTTAATSHEKSPSKKLVALMDPPMSKKKIKWKSCAVTPWKSPRPFRTFGRIFEHHESVSLHLTLCTSCVELMADLLLRRKILKGANLKMLSWVIGSCWKILNKKQSLIETKVNSALGHSHDVIMLNPLKNSWVTGTNDLSTKRLMFQVLFFS